MQRLCLSLGHHWSTLGGAGGGGWRGNVNVVVTGLQGLTQPWGSPSTCNCPNRAPSPRGARVPAPTERPALGDPECLPQRSIQPWGSPSTCPDRTPSPGGARVPAPTAFSPRSTPSTCPDRAFSPGGAPSNCPDRVPSISLSGWTSGALLHTLSVGVQEELTLREEAAGG